MLFKSLYLTLLREKYYLKSISGSAYIDFPFGGCRKKRQLLIVKPNWLFRIC